MPLNIVCFRYRAAGYNDEESNRLNQELLILVQAVERLGMELAGAGFGRASRTS